MLGNSFNWFFLNDLFSLKKKNKETTLKMPFGTKKKTEKEEKDGKKQNKVTQVNQYFSNCPHRPPQSLTPKEETRKIGKQSSRSYLKLNKLK